MVKPTPSQVTRLNIYDARLSRRRGEASPLSRWTARRVPVPTASAFTTGLVNVRYREVRRGIDPAGDLLGTRDDRVDPVELEVGRPDRGPELLERGLGVGPEVLRRRAQVTGGAIEPDDHDHEHHQQHQADLCGEHRNPFAPAHSCFLRSTSLPRPVGCQ